MEDLVPTQRDGSSSNSEKEAVEKAVKAVLDVKEEKEGRREEDEDEDEDEDDGVTEGGGGKDVPSIACP